MDFVLGVIKGIFLGAGAILPGISSGVLCVIFGIYEKIINSIINYFKDIKQNTKFLLPLILGICIGVVLFGNLLKLLYANFKVPTMFCFIGLILGSIPCLFKTANQSKGFRLHYIIYTIGTFLLTIFFLYIEKISGNLNISHNTTFMFLVFTGFIMSIGVVIPGVSSSVLLMIIGSYDVYIFAISTADLSILFPIGIGLIIGGFVFLLLIRYFLYKFHTQTYYSIIGFVLGSIPILYPGLNFDIIGLFSISIFFMSFYLGYLLEKQ